MDVFFLLVGSASAVLFLFVGAGTNIGLGIICGLSFVAAAIVRLAQAGRAIVEGQAVCSKKSSGMVHAG